MWWQQLVFLVMRWKKIVDRKTEMKMGEALTRRLHSAFGLKMPINTKICLNVWELNCIIWIHFWSFVLDVFAFVESIDSWSQTEKHGEQSVRYDEQQKVEAGSRTSDCWGEDCGLWWWGARSNHWAALTPPAFDFSHQMDPVCVCMQICQESNPSSVWKA